MGSTSSQPESQPSDGSQPRKPWKPIQLCGTLPTLVVPAEHYVEQLWAALDQTLHYSKCGIGSDTPVGEGGTLDLNTCTIVGATAPSKPFNSCTRSPTTTRALSGDEGVGRLDSEEHH